MQRNRWIGWMVGCVTTLALAGCDDGTSETEPGTPSGGERIFSEPVEDGNTFACATCHAIDDAEDDFRRVGHALGGATRRGSYKNGQLTEFREAVNSCLTEWMNADPWTEDDERYVALESFIDEGSGAEEDVVFEIVEPPAGSKIEAGDAARGQALFNDSCAACHGADGIGSTLAIPVASGQLEPGYAASRIRRSGSPFSEVYTGLAGGVMPFWAADRLSDDELADIVAWLSRDYDPNAEPEPQPQPEPDPDDDDIIGSCTEEHPKVGQIAELEMLFHDVGGTAEIIDDCTIAIRDFTFDGQGIDVQIYAGVGGDYDGGFSISDNLLRPGGYNGETLVLELPPGSTLDDVDGISVWCVPVGADFGSGFFNPA